MTGNMPRSPGEVGVKSSASGVPAACRPSAHGGRLYRSRWGGGPVGFDTQCGWLE